LHGRRENVINVTYDPCIGRRIHIKLTKIGFVNSLTSLNDKSPCEINPEILLTYDRSKGDVSVKTSVPFDCVEFGAKFSYNTEGEQQVSFKAGMFEFATKL